MVSISWITSQTDIRPNISWRGGPLGLWEQKSDHISSAWHQLTAHTVKCKIKHVRSRNRSPKVSPLLGSGRSSWCTAAPLSFSSGEVTVHGAARPVSPALYKYNRRRAWLHVITAGLSRPGSTGDAQSFSFVVRPTTSVSFPPRISHFGTSRITAIPRRPTPFHLEWRIYRNRDTVLKSHRLVPSNNRSARVKCGKQILQKLQTEKY